MHLRVSVKHVHDVFNVSFLESFHRGGDGQDAPAFILVDGEVKYEVDLIGGHWISRVVRWYLVSFAG